jgi:hypothetical protein
LPLYQFPTLVAWRSDKLAGPVDALVSAIYSPLGNAYAWSVK